MTKDVVSCVPGDSVEAAAELMLRHHVGSLPVVRDEESRELAGVITDRDLVIRVMAGKLDPASTRVGDVMTAEVVSCRPADDVSDAVELMMKHQIRRLFVVEEGRLAGVVAQADVASRTGEPYQTARMVQRISQPGVPEPAEMDDRV